MDRFYPTKREKKFVYPQPHAQETFCELSVLKDGVTFVNEGALLSTSPGTEAHCHPP
jgi:hypothetical protein